MTNNDSKKKEKLKELLGEALFQKLVDLRTFLFVLQVPDYEAIIKEVDRRIIDGKGKEYLETLKGVLNV